MGDLLRKAASPEILNLAWKKLKNDKSVWDEGISRNDMEKDMVFHIMKLSNELKTGQYRPSQIRMFPVKKADGNKRIISAFTLRDKLAQRAVLSVLNPIGESYFHQDSYGYRKGRSIDMTMGRIYEYVRCGFEWVVDADINSFFDSIPHGKLMKIIKKYFKDDEVVNILHKWVDTGSPRTGILQKRRGIPQGGVISPFLCNLYLTEFDNYLSKKNLPFVRFADDFLVFTKKGKDAYSALETVQLGLKKIDLKINPDKTKVVRSGPKVVFLGRKLPFIHNK